MPYLRSTKELQPALAHFSIISLVGNEISIGRALDNHAVIAASTISRKHCVLRKQSDMTWTIEDLSTFGMSINNVKLPKNVQQKLNDTDIVRFDPNGEFEYEYLISNWEPPMKKSRHERNTFLETMKKRFNESQAYEIEHLENKLHSAQKMQETSRILQEQKEYNMSRQMKTLMKSFEEQIESLNSEKSELEKQKKIQLEHERDSKAEEIRLVMIKNKQEFDAQIQKLNETEKQLLEENRALNERLEIEKAKFMEELNRENASKQTLLEELEAKLKKQEEERAKQKLEMEEMLRQQTAAREAALKELEEKKEQEKNLIKLDIEHFKNSLNELASVTAEEKRLMEEEYVKKIAEAQKKAEEDRLKLEEMVKLRQDAEAKLREAQEDSEKNLNELSRKAIEREAEMAALFEARIQEQAGTSRQAVQQLQEQLAAVQTNLCAVETERSEMLQSILTESDPAEAKRTVLTEFGALMESELQCSICAELFVASTTLGCAHTFCKHCITLWRKKKNDCPICRTKITSECRSLVLDTFIEKMVQNLTDEMKAKRTQMLREREELEKIHALELASTSNGRRGGASGPRAASAHSEIYESAAWDSEDYSSSSDYPLWEHYSHSSTDDGLDSHADSDADSDDEGDSDDDSELGSDPADPTADHLGVGSAPNSGPDAQSSGAAPGGAASAPCAAAAVPGAGASASGTVHSGAVLAGHPQLAGSGGDAARVGGRSERRSRASGRAEAGRRPRRTVEGIPGSYYGGYGRCYSCGARGHWAPGCPFR